MNIRSLQRLDKAHPDLRRLMIESAKKCPVAIEVGEVLRSRARQAQVVKAGASATMNSRHLAHPSDGLSRATDIVCTIGGKVSWDWPLFFEAARHVQLIAQRLGIRVTWGGVWDRCLNDLSAALEKEVRDYITRARARGVKKPLIDGPHFQLDWKAYP